MNNKITILSIIAVIISFIGGFILANGLNRSEMEKLRAQLAALQKESPGTAAENPEITLSDEEIKQKIAEADANPNDFAFQKGLGMSLYKYAAMKKNSDLLGETERILNRANQLNPNDYEIIVTLGNLNFDIGFFKNDRARFEKARGFYQNALAQKPADVEVLTDVAMTFLLQNPPEIEKATAGFQKSLAVDAKHEKSLYFLTQAYLRKGDKTEAEKTLARLKEINPNVPTLEQIQAQLKPPTEALNQ